MRQNIEIVTLLSESSCFSLGLKEGKDVSLPNWSLDIPHDVTVLIVQKLHSNLSDLSSGSRTTHNFHNHSMLNLWFHPAQTHTFTIVKRRARKEASDIRSVCLSQVLIKYNKSRSHWKSLCYLSIISHTFKNHSLNNSTKHKYKQSKRLFG